MRKKIHNVKSLTDRRKELRSSLTPAEAALWSIIRNGKIDGRKFRRQHSVDGYILDFYCPDEKLAIELDGAGHFTEQGALSDIDRTSILQRYNIRVVRFENKLVFQHTDFVIEEIRKQFIF